MVALRRALLLALFLALALSAAPPAEAATMRPFPDRVHVDLFADRGDLVVYRSTKGRRYRVLNTRTGRRRDWLAPAGCARIKAMAGTRLLFRCSKNRFVVLSATTGRRVRAPGLRSLYSLPNCRESDCTIEFDRFGKRWGEVSISVTDQRTGKPGPWHGWVEWHTGELRVNPGRLDHRLDPDAPELLRPICVPDGGGRVYGGDWVVVQRFASVSIRHCTRGELWEIEGNRVTALPHIAGAVDWPNAAQPARLTLFRLSNRRREHYRLHHVAPRGSSDMPQVLLTRTHVIARGRGDHPTTRKPLRTRVSWAPLPR